MNWLFAVLLAVRLLTNDDVAGQSKSGSIQGVWQVVEVTTTGPGARTIVIPEPRANLTILTARHYSRIEWHADTRPDPTDVTKASAAELRAAWGPFFGEAGTYVTDGNLITMRPIVAKNPAAMAPGAFSTWSYRLEGDTLWVTAEKNADGPVVHPVTVKAVRVE
jgi:hypothetical protein